MAEFDPDAYLADFDPDKYLGATPKPKEETLGEKALGYVSSGLSGLNRGLFALPHRAGLTRALGKTLFPNLTPEEAEAKVEFRHLPSERKNPMTASLGAGLGVTPYMALIPGAAGPIAMGATQGAVAGNLLSESNTLGGSLADTGVGAATGAATSALPVAMGKLSEKLNRTRLRQTVKGAGVTPDDVATLREKVGTPYGDVGVEAGAAAVNLKTPSGKPIVETFQPPDVKLKRLGEAANYWGPRVGELAKEADSISPGSVDVDTILNRMGRHVSEMDTGPERAFAGGKNAERAAELLAAFRKEAKGYRATSTNVELGAPPQGRLGLSTTELVPGPEATFPAPRQIGTDVAYQGGLPITGTSLHAGPESVMFRPASSSPSIQQRALLDELTSGRPRAIPPESKPVGQTLGIQRDMFGTPSGAAVPNGPLMTQDPAIAQSVAGQGRINQPSFPERALPTAISTNVTPKTMDVREAIAFKRWLQDEVYTTARRTNPNRPADAIRKDPDLLFKQKLANVFKEEAEKGFERAMPHKATAFAEANGKYSDLMDFEFIISNSANKAASKPSSGDVSRYGYRAFLYPAIAGAAATGNLPVAGAAAGGELAHILAQRYGHQAAAATAKAAAGGAERMSRIDPQLPMQVLLAELLRSKKEGQ